MKLKELFNQSKSSVSSMGTNKFRLTLNKDFVKTPHFVMQKVNDILDSRPNLRNGLSQHCRFLLNNISFASSDDKSTEFANDWLNTRKKLRKEMFDFVLILIGGGTSYLEPIWATGKNGKKYILNYEHFPDSSVVYKNLTAKDESEYWLVELPIEVRNYNGLIPKFHPVYYIKNSYIFRKLVWSINLPKDKLVQATTGWSLTKDYGHGLLSSAVDNEMIHEEITKNWALIAKYRSLGKKIIGFYNDNGETVDMPELDNLKSMFDELQEEESLLVNKKFVSEDLTFNGNDNMMESQIDYLRKDSGSALVPNFMTAFSQDSSMATASEAKIPFSLDLAANQEELVELFNEIIVKDLRESYPWLSDDLTIVLRKPDLYSRMENFMNIQQLYNLRAATFNELRIAAGLETVEGGDIWGESPPLDKTSITIKKDGSNIPMKENLKRIKKFKESYKELFTEPKKETFSIVYTEITKGKKGKKGKQFKEAVKELMN